MNDSPLPIVIPAVGIALALVVLLLGLRAARRRRLVDNLPTSKTTGVFIGLVELKGTAEAEQPLTSYLAGGRCVYFRWEVEEHWSRTVVENYTDGQGKSQTRTRREEGWTTVASGGDQVRFYLKDDCGAILVRPAGAKIEPGLTFDETCGRTDPLYYGKGPATSVANSDHRRRFTEEAIPLHAPLFLVGHAREREDVVAPEIAADTLEPLFLISTRTEKQVSRGFRLGSFLLPLLGLVLVVGGFVVGNIVGDARRPEAEDTARFAAVAGAFVLAWLVGWFWMLYNSLIDLRQRVRQAWSNVDVQLKRRHDLIPALVAAVSGMRDYEQHVQAELTGLRTQLQATPPGQAGPDPAAVAPLVRAITEAYPELKSSESFLDLQRQLSDTEQRIALARSYFNDIATFYNTRLQVVPDRFAARLARLQPESLMAATDFERAPVAVAFAG